MMNRKDFLNLSTRAALFLGLAPAVACSSSQINSSDETQQKIKQLLSVINKRKYMYVGDVSFYMLPYCEFILKVYPDSKFICLKRGKVDTVKSYCEKTQGRNHWQTHCGNKYKNCVWDSLYYIF